MSISLLSCTTDSREENLNEKTNVNLKQNIDNAARIVTEEELFSRSVAIIKFNYDLEPSSNVPLRLKLVTFDKDYKLLPVYKFNNIEYSDNGEFNDQIAGDGIYTSIENFNIATEDIYNGVEVNVGETFLYKDQLIDLVKNDYLNRGIKPKAVIKFGCKVRIVKCPNTSWYNTSIFGEPCVEFYDCEASVEVELGVN